MTTTIAITPPPKRRRLSRAARVGPFVERLYQRYHRPALIGSDPLTWPRAYDRPADREVVAFVAAALAYGNVRQIDRSLHDLFGRVGRSPSAFARDFVPGKSDRALEGFYHRFNTDRDLSALFHLIGQMLRGWGSIEAFWESVQDDRDHGDIADRAARFIHAALELDLDPYYPAIKSTKRPSFLYLLPQADGPSACKRLNLFLRWVVRPDDGIDLGLWTVEKPSALEFPIDTHILRLSKYLGATRRKDAGAKTRREVTAFFRRIDPADPVRFDFSLCRLGILGHCPPKQQLDLCRQCELRPECLRYRRLAPPGERRALAKA